jgi:hypothetical protein
MNLFKQKVPAPTPASPMPDPEVAGMAARRAAEAAALARAGRASTILTAPSTRDKAAAPTYDTYSAKSLGT